MNNNELYHHGVKGMKWGVRRKRQSKSSKNNKFKKKTEEVHDDYKRAHSNKSVKSMSDNELRSRINRLQMEQNYSKLKGQKVSKGKKIFDKMNKTLTTAAAITGTGLTLYNNASRIKKVLEENGVFSNTVENAKKKAVKKTMKKTMKKAAKRASRVAVDYYQPGLLPYNK